MFAIGAQLEMRMRRTVMWPLGIYYAFSQYIINDKILGGGGEEFKNKMRFPFFFTLLKHFFF